MKKAIVYLLMRSAGIAALLVWISLSLLASDSEITGSGRFCVPIRHAACRVVHGRYGIYAENNGIVDTRTNKLLGTAGDGELDHLIYQAGGNYWDHEIVENFTICPRSSLEDTSKTGSRVTQYVCVKRFRNTRVVKRHQ